MTPEPWMRGPLPGVSPTIAPMLRSFEQVNEDLALHLSSLTVEQLWTRPQGSAPAGYHLRHIAGSVERLSAYLEGRQLREDQLQRLRNEQNPGDAIEVLLVEIRTSLQQAAELFLKIDLTRLEEPRTVGRKQLPTTVIGLMVHICEHTQRHLGQAITLAKIVKGT